MKNRKYINLIENHFNDFGHLERKRATIIGNTRTAYFSNLYWFSVLFIDAIANDYADVEIVPVKQRSIEHAKALFTRQIELPQLGHGHALKKTVWI